MNRVSKMLALPILLSLSFITFAQSLAEKPFVKQKRILLNEILEEIPNLKLARNRAYAHANVGKLLWEFDKKRAHAEFQKAFKELHQAQIELEKYLSSRSLTSDGLNVRNRLLQLIGTKDAKLALDFMYMSRNKKLTKALALEKTGYEPFRHLSDWSRYRRPAQAELQLAQILLSNAAAQHPDEAVKLLKESLRFDLSLQTFTLLKKLHKRDQESANDIAKRKVDILVKKEITPTTVNAYRNYLIAFKFLNDFIKAGPAEEKLKLEEPAMRKLAKKVLDYTEKQGGGGFGSGFWSGILPIAKRFFPERAKQMDKSRNIYRFHAFGKYRKEIEKLLESDLTAEEKLKASSKYPDRYRRNIIQRISNRSANDGDKVEAREILTKYFAGAALTEMISDLEWNLAKKATKAGNFDEALGYIPRMHKNMRLVFLLDLAKAIYRKNPLENKDKAVGLVKQALSLIESKSEDYNGFRLMLRVITAYLEIESDEAFELFEPIIPKLNKIAGATRTLYGFRGNSNVRNGEYLLAGNSWGFDLGNFAHQGRLLVKQDFRRTVELINRFEHREIRINLKFQLLATAFN